MKSLSIVAHCDGLWRRVKPKRLRQRMVDGWRKLFGHQNYTAENVKCDGCLSDGQVADRICQARPCAREKGVENCAHCDEFPCDKMEHLMASREGMLTGCYPRTPSVTKEEYNLCMRQFESMPNLLRMLVRSDKISSWVNCQEPYNSAEDKNAKEMYKVPSAGKLS